MASRIFGLLILISTIFFMAPGVKAQDYTDTTYKSVSNYPVKKLYFSNGFDAALFQSSILSRPGRTNDLSTIRFSYFLNLEGHLNYDVSNSFGLFTGLGIKNIGFIDKVSDSTIKRRVYTIGAPLGLKFGNLQKKKYVFIGGGLDIPVHYKEKGFVNRGDKKKTSEWFSDQPSFLMPYVFAGFTLNERIMLKAQYYPGNFMNTSYSISSTTPGGTPVYIYPYANYEVNLFFISVGITPKIKDKGKTKKEGIPKKMS